MTGNADMAAFWNGATTRFWSEGHGRIDRLFAGLTETALDHAAPRTGERVLDIGCGSGTTVLALSERVGAGGRVTGLDLSAASVATARERIAAAGLAQAEVFEGDAALHTFEPASFDLAFSRFGVMFFSDPVATFRHIRGALKPGGRFACVVFREPRENPFATGPVAAVRSLLPPDALPPSPPDAPGQFGWARPEHVRAILDGAGFHDITLTPHDVRMRLAGPGEAAEAADYAMRVGPLTRIGPSLSDATRDAVRAGLEAFFAGHDGPEGIVLPGALWLVRAQS